MYTHTTLKDSDIEKLFMNKAETLKLLHEPINDSEALKIYFSWVKRPELKGLFYKM